MHIDNLCANLPHPVSQNYFLACYAISLIQGKTIFGTTDQSNIVKNYIHVACDLLPATSQHAPSSCKTNFVDVVICMLRNYKLVPKRCNMINEKMTLWMTTLIPTLPPTHPFVAIFDWVTLSRYAGFRALEWCQSSQHTYITSWPSQPLEAFITDDFKLFLNGEIPINNITMYPSATIASVCIWWPTQKNNQNSEKIPFFCDAINPHLCPVAAAIHIVQRARLLHNNPGPY